MADIKHMIAIKAPADEVYRLVATGAGFSQWWAADVTESGEETTLSFFNRDTVYRLRRGPTAAPREIEWRCLSGHEWEGTRMVFQLKEQSGTTQVRFMHADWKSESDYFTSCNTTWGELMFRLKAAAEGKASGPLFTATDMAY